MHLDTEPIEEPIDLDSVNEETSQDNPPKGTEGRGHDQDPDDEIKDPDSILRLGETEAYGKFVALWPVDELYYEGVLVVYRRKNWKLKRKALYRIKNLSFHKSFPVEKIKLVNLEKYARYPHADPHATPIELGVRKTAHGNEAKVVYIKL